MSFINLLANDVWSDADIKSRLHAEIRSEVSELAETELNRALQGAIMKLHTLTPQEQQSLMRFKGATDRVALLGTAARADMALLTSVLAYERAQARLLQALVTEPLTVTVVDTEGVSREVVNPELALDDAQRTDAQAVIDDATAEVLELVALRSPKSMTANP